MSTASKLPVRWRKSSYSTNGGNCLEVGEGLANVVPVRDSKVTDGPVLMVSADAWSRLVGLVRADG
ncbi:DUF397 domain-containing protein [Streptomyces sp. NPDC001549]|uniref:DUF397 domain-containing protein n=1 Tax=Streptomyces sp. NPDC001549 TaxID=3364586 RepID=UPI00367AE9F7